MAGRPLQDRLSNPDMDVAAKSRKNHNEWGLQLGVLPKKRLE